MLSFSSIPSSNAVLALKFSLTVPWPAYLLENPATCQWAVDNNFTLVTPLSTVLGAIAANSSWFINTVRGVTPVSIGIVDCQSGLTGGIKAKTVVTTFV
jgi:hypothetical protein